MIEFMHTHQLAHFNANMDMHVCINTRCFFSSFCLARLRTFSCIHTQTHTQTLSPSLPSSLPPFLPPSLPQGVATDLGR